MYCVCPIHLHELSLHKLCPMSPHLNWPYLLSAYEYPLVVAFGLGKKSLDKPTEHKKGCYVQNYGHKIKIHLEKTEDQTRLYQQIFFLDVSGLCWLINSHSFGDGKNQRSRVQFPESVLGAVGWFNCTPTHPRLPIKFIWIRGWN